MFGGVKSGIQRRKGVVSTVRIQTEKKPAPLPSVERARQQTSQIPSQSRDSSARPSPSSATASPATPATPSSDLNESSHLRPPKRKVTRQLSPSSQPIMSDTSGESSDSNSDLTDHKSFKRQKLDHDVDVKRRLRSKKAFSDEDGGSFAMIHAADLCPSSRSSKASSENVTVELKYPSASQLERFYLDFGKDKIDSLEEIINVARIVRDVYLTKKQAKAFKAPNSGVIRRLAKAQNAITSNKAKRLDPSLLQDFKNAVDFYNTTMFSLLHQGALAKNLDNMHHLPLEMVQFILQQVYDRAVSPNVDDLRVYKTGSDGVYGELLSPFVHRVLVQCGLKSDQVFVDLGSGVGNVVLQAALEFGCESWGCEMMPNACKLARKQAAEFKARCRLWGLKTGKVRLEEGDFLENAAIGAVLRRADVVLVNNEVFGEETNKALGLLFLDLKDGCHIISLQSFARGSPRNHHDPANIIQNTTAKPLPFGDRDVSWTGNGGEYFIATKDEAHLARMRAANEG